MSDFSDDRQKAIGICEAFCQPGTIRVVIIPGDPISKARPRWNASRKPYTPKKTVEGEKTIAWSLKSGNYGPYTGNVAVVCIFRRSNFQRIDVDNLLKAVLDGGTKAGIWHDDSQVTALVGIAEHDRESPRTTVALGAHKSTLQRGENTNVACEACGKMFTPFGNQRRGAVRWCSKECSAYLREPVSCAQCGTLFKRTNGYQKYCSEACRVAVLRVRNRAASKKPCCKHGHPLEGSNLHILPNGSRRCRKCQANNASVYREAGRMGGGRPKKIIPLLPFPG